MIVAVPAKFLRLPSDILPPAIVSALGDLMVYAV